MEEVQNVPRTVDGPLESIEKQILGRLKSAHVFSGGGFVQKFEGEVDRTKLFHDFSIVWQAPYLEREVSHLAMCTVPTRLEFDPARLEDECAVKTTSRAETPPKKSNIHTVDITGLRFPPCTLLGHAVLDTFLQLQLSFLIERTLALPFSLFASSRHSPPPHTRAL